MQIRTEQRETLIETFHDFLEEIGIVLREGEVPSDSFLPGVCIHSGSVVYDRNTLLYPGDILHEAGHIAVTDSSKRDNISGNVAEVNSGKSAEEQAVLLWTWAAINKIGIPPEVVFHPAGYKNESDSLIEDFESGEYEGLDLLVWMKMTRSSEERGGFPQMTNWLRP
jgi:hypothetical protein